MPERSEPRVERLITERYELAEGCGWHDGRWRFVDLLQGRLLEHTGAPRERPRELLRLDVPLGRVLPAADGTSLAIAGAGFARLGADGEVTWLARPERQRSGVRMNDGGVDVHGRVWGGAMRMDMRPGTGRVHRLEPDGTSTCVVEGITIPNGPAFTPDGRVMYLADSAAGVVYRHELSADGDLAGRELFATWSEGSPDGMALDAEGGLWIAIWGQGRVERRDRDGRLTMTVALPARQPSCPALGGPDGCELLITTAALGLPPGAADGAIYHTRVEVPAAPVLLAAPLC